MAMGAAAGSWRLRQRLRRRRRPSNHLSIISTGDTSTRLHWGSLTETIGGKTYVACVSENHDGRCY